MGVTYSWKKISDKKVIKRANTVWVVFVIDRLVLPLLYLIANFTRLTPNMVTVLGMVSTFVALYFYSQGQFILGIIFQQLTLVMDAIDGKLARLTKQTSPFGKLYDNIVDRMRSFVPMMGLIYFAFSKTLDVNFVFWGMMYLVWDLLVIYMYDQSFRMNDNKLLKDIIEVKGSLLAKIRNKFGKYRLTLMYSNMEAEVVLFVIGPILSYWYGLDMVLYGMITATMMMVGIFVIFLLLQCKVAWSQKN